MLLNATFRAAPFGLRELLAHELEEIRAVERRLVAILPRLLMATRSPELKAALLQNLSETEEHFTRLDDLLPHSEGEWANAGHEAVNGLLLSANQVLLQIPRGSARDAAIIAAVQRLEHLEITAYGTALAHAKALGERELVLLLGRTLEEESGADDKLSLLAESINLAARTGTDAY